MLWVYRGHKAIVVLRDGTTLQGQIGWSWIAGHWLLRDVEVLRDEDQAQEMLGKTIIPRTSVTFVQVM